MAERWEYFIATLPAAYTNEQQTAYLQDCADKGWELVSVTTAYEGKTFYFRRKKS